MQVVSGRIDRKSAHFEAPAREGLEAQLDEFLVWFAVSRRDDTFDPLLRSGIAHFWFITRHPFDDGNGRLARALTALALAQSQPQAIRLHSTTAAARTAHEKSAHRCRAAVSRTPAVGLRTLALTADSLAILSTVERPAPATATGDDREHRCATPDAHNGSFGRSRKSRNACSARACCR